MENLPGFIASNDAQGRSNENRRASFSFTQPSNGGELKDMLLKVKNKREVYIILEWAEENNKPCITSLQIGSKVSARRDERNISISILNRNEVKLSIPELRDIFEGSNCIKVMFSPRQDFTNLLHYGIRIKNLFDVQSCVQCVQSDGSNMDTPKTLEQICHLYGIINNATNELEHVSKLCTLIETYIFLRKQGGEWFRASKRIKYMYKRKVIRLVRLTQNQRHIIRDAKRPSMEA